MIMMHQFDTQERLVAEKAVDALAHAQKQALSTHDVMVVKNNHLVLLSKDGAEKVIKPVDASVSVVRGSKIIRTA